MAENTDVPEKPDDHQDDQAAAADQAPAVAPEPPNAAPQGPRLRDRAFAFRAVVAVAAATLLIGAAGGAGLAAWAEDDDGPRVGRFADGPGWEGPRHPFGPGDRGPRFHPGDKQDRSEQQEPGSTS